MKIIHFASIRRWVSLAAEIAVIGGVVFAGLAYSGEWQRSQHEASLTYIEEFNSGDVLAARNELYRFIRQKENMLLVDIPNKARSAFIDRSMQGSEVTAHELAVVTLVNFFDSVDLCAKSKVCNRELLEQHLSDYASRFRCLYADFIDRRIAGDFGASGPFGSGLIALAEKSGDC
ncbi:hypothetical protein HPDFL43_14727 [Hoeflea phototrophica DFL-43]|jgi:hypothetical protein|uniref:Uncharacterized protein n=1 Tax=Hoeflea phototrophica (strain DSM 17068 / NCIMB 14078 / DFL-43) TaxID=411684 RepID=A9D2S0_HOEPD|nr:hypothetical protein [Hoeflea phototrophica]EDQ34261.2 hypothetical protein HPDFL43_14727 [Hoeflea phototrophica DFL-43]